MKRARDRLVLAAPFEYRVLEDEHGKPYVQFGPLFGKPGFLARQRFHRGWPGLPVDDDDVVRRIDYAIEPEKDALAATLASATAQVAGTRTNELPRGAERRASDDQSSHTTWIDYHGGTGTFRSISARNVLSGRVAPDAFRDKIVVIGLVSHRFAGDDWFPTSLDDSMSGPEIHANAIATMLDGSDLRDVSGLVDVLLIVALGLVPILAWALRPRLTAALIVGAALLFAAAAYLLFASGWIVAVVAPLAALTLATLGILLAEAVQRSMRRRAH
jgi:CHASE2 domain-containing sensor protein